MSQVLLVSSGPASRVKRKKKRARKKAETETEDGKGGVFATFPSFESFLGEEWWNEGSDEVRQRKAAAIALLQQTSESKPFVFAAGEENEEIVSAETKEGPNASPSSTSKVGPKPRLVKRDTFRAGTGLSKAEEKLRERTHWAQPSRGGESESFMLFPEPENGNRRDDAGALSNPLQYYRCGMRVSGYGFSLVQIAGVRGSSRVSVTLCGTSRFMEPLSADFEFETLGINAGTGSEILQDREAYAEIARRIAVRTSVNGEKEIIPVANAVLKAEVEERGEVGEANGVENEVEVQVEIVHEERGVEHGVINEEEKEEIEKDEKEHEEEEGEGGEEGEEKDNQEEGEGRGERVEAHEEWKEEEQGEDQEDGTEQTKLDASPMIEVDLLSKDEEESVSSISLTKHRRHHGGGQESKAEVSRHLIARRTRRREQGNKPWKRRWEIDDDDEEEQEGEPEELANGRGAGEKETMKMAVYTLRRRTEEGAHVAHVVLPLRGKGSAYGEEELLEMLWRSGMQGENGTLPVVSELRVLSREIIEARKHTGKKKKKMVEVGDTEEDRKNDET